MYDFFHMLGMHLLRLELHFKYFYDSLYDFYTLKIWSWNALGCVLYVIYHMLNMHVL